MHFLPPFTCYAVHLSFSLSYCNFVFAPPVFNTSLTGIFLNELTQPYSFVSQHRAVLNLDSLIVCISLYSFSHYLSPPTFYFPSISRLRERTYVPPGKALSEGSVSCILLEFSQSPVNFSTPAGRQVDKLTLSRHLAMHLQEKCIQINSSHPVGGWQRVTLKDGVCVCVCVYGIEEC